VSKSKKFCVEMIEAEEAGAGEAEEVVEEGVKRRRKCYNPIFKSKVGFFLVLFFYFLIKFIYRILKINNKDKG
jgi:hypothetical protein